MVCIDNFNAQQYCQNILQKKEEIFKKEHEDLGLKEYYKLKELPKFKTIDELKSHNPLMVTAEILNGGNLNVNGETDRVEKGDVLVMQYNTYINSFIDKKLGIRIFRPHKIKFQDLFKRYNGQDLTNKKLLIWRFGGIGDVMFSQPIVKYLKNKYPTCKIHFCTSKGILPLFRAWPTNLINRCYTIPFSIQVLKDADYHLSFEGSIERCEEAEYTNCYDIFQKVAGLNFNVKDYMIELKTHELKKYIKEIIGKDMILLQMKSSSPIRTLSSYKWVEIIKKLYNRGFKNLGVIDHPRFYEIYELLKKDYNIPYLVNLSRCSTDIQMGVNILNYCKGLIGVDSSFTHLSAALKKPTLGLYGPFLGDLRMRYYENADWIDSTNYKECGLYPCFFHQNSINMCPFVQQKLPVGCMDSIDTTEIVNKFEILLERI